MQNNLTNPDVAIDLMTFMDTFYDEHGDLMHELEDK